VNVIVQTGLASLLRRAAARHEKLAWLAKLRGEAVASLQSSGLPTRRDEAWKYTDLAPVASLSFGAAPDRAATLPPPRAAQRAVFVNGRFEASLSTLPGFAAPLAARLDDAQGWLGTVAADGPLVAMNTALFEDGLVIDLPAGMAGGTLELLSLAASGDAPHGFHPRHLIRLGAGASLTLIESCAGEGRTLHNPVFEISVAEGATLTHARINEEDRAAFHLAAIHARVAARGTYDSFVLNLGGRLTRGEIHVALEGPEATAHLNGAQLLAGDQHADATTSLDHAAPNCPSRQVYKTVLSGRSRGVFQGKILVRQAAQKTDGYQMNQAMLLSETAEMDCKPQLEIYADDVKCSHGATIGALDEAQLFFLRSRGIPAAEARAMLVAAFLQEAVDGIQDETAREAVNAALARAQGAPA
jgi:Fe-S cluster assembly protein SufD